MTDELSSESQNRTIKATAMEWFQLARKYHEAADLLLQHRAAGEPTYFLYFHTIELALKAFLRSHNRPIPRGQKGHKLTDLYERCRELRLVVVGPNDHLGIGNIVSMLEFSNESQGLRYIERGMSAPSLDWTREVVGQLMEAVEPHVDACSKLDRGPKRQRLGLIWGRPSWAPTKPKGPP